MPTLATWPSSTSGGAAPPTVEYSRETMEQVRRHALLGFLSVPKIGAGAGGLLLGERTPDGVRILGSVEIPCSHASGPAFALTDAEILGALGLVRQPRQVAVVGWYVSRTRGAIELGDREMSIYGILCAEPWQIALVLQPRAVHTTKAVLCYRDGTGAILRGQPESVDAWAADEEDVSDLETESEAAVDEPVEVSESEPVAEVSPAPVAPPAPPVLTPAAAAPPPPLAAAAPPVARRPNMPQAPPPSAPLESASRPSEGLQSAPPRATGTRSDKLRFAQGMGIPDFRHDEPGGTPGVFPIRPQFAKEPVPTGAEAAGREVNQSTAANPRAAGVIPIRPQFKTPTAMKPGSGPQPYGGPMVPPQPKTRRFWTILGSAVLVLLTVAGYVVKDAWIPRPPLKLDITESKGEISVQWNKEAVAGVEQASLILNDSGQLESVLLSSKQLASGSYTYKHKSNRVTAIIRSGEERVFAVWEAPTRPPELNTGATEAVTPAGTATNSKTAAPVQTPPTQVPAATAPATPRPQPGGTGPTATAPVATDKKP